MPDISGLAERKAIIDARPGHYLCFPDVAVLPDGRLLAVYREADQHVATRRKLLAAVSADGGRTWQSAAPVTEGRGHCPRISLPASGTIAVTDDNGSLHLSRDGGKTWRFLRGEGIRHGVTDRITVLPDGSWLTTAHRHLEGDIDPRSAQRPTEQVVFRSTDQGATWQQHGVLAPPGPLVLCEASVVPLPGGRLLALLRENSHVFEPLYRCESLDDGRTWSPPQPTPVIGHRPTAGITADGRLLVTYRDTGLAGGVAAWLGDEKDFSGFAPQTTPAARTKFISGADSTSLDHDQGQPPLVILRPLTAPEADEAVLEATLLCRSGACGLRLGGWWRVTPTSLSLLAPPEDDAPAACNAPVLAETPLSPERAHTIRLHWRGGVISACVDGELRAEVALPADSVRRRPVLVGGLPDGSPCSAQWFGLAHHIDFATGERHRWAASGPGGILPPEGPRTLTLAPPNGAAWFDYGYTGWAEPSPGRFCCVTHLADGDDPEYTPGHSSHVVSILFRTKDFTP